VNVAFATPLWLLGLTAVVLLGMAIRTYAGAPLSRPRRVALASFRFLTLMAIAVFLMRPMAVTPVSRGAATVPVVIDASRSMAIADAEGGTRYERALQLATSSDSPLQRALGDFRVELLELRNDVVPFGASRAPDGSGSDLAAAIETVRARYRDRLTPGIVLLSDGVDTGRGAPAGDPSAAPVFAIGIGDEQPPPDQEVLSLDVDREALPGSTIQLTASVVSHGQGRGPIDVRLLAGGRPIDLRRVAPDAEGLPARVEFRLPPAGGEPIVYTVEVPSRPGETLRANNARHTVVQPIGRKRRVLFVQGGPGYEHGFLARAWAGDPFLELDSVVRKGQNDSGDATFYVQAAAARASSLTSALPVDRAALFAYDAIVIGNATADLLSSAQASALQAFVNERGGGLLVLGARSFGANGVAGGPIGDLLPVTRRPVPVDAARASFPGGARAANHLTLTPDGETHPVLRLGQSRDETSRRWNEAPALASIASAGQPRPGAQVLAVASTSGVARPVLALQRFGEGRTMVFAGEASWRWKMQRPLDDRLYDTFWRQVARWLTAPSPDPVMVEIDADLQPARPATISVAVRDAAFEPLADAEVEVVVRDAQGASHALRATAEDAARGRYVATWTAGSPGLVRITATARRAGDRLVSPEQAIFVGGADLETTDPRRHDSVLARLAEGSGGRLLDAAGIEDLARVLQARVDASPALTTRELWHGPWTFLAVVSLLCVEWTLRRQWGLR
jgi:uncharacterized membrane protein